MNTKILRDPAFYKISVNIRLRPKTLERLRRTKRELFISHTEAIEQGLKLFFAEQGIK